MISSYLPSVNGRIHTYRFGTGPELLIAMHGFSDRARMFTVLEPALASKYTVVALDLPFHGQTEWNKKTFTKEDLLAIIRQILEQQGKTRFSIMAFSFGARLAQAMLPELAPQINHLYLISPDGIKTKGMTTATRTPMWMRRLLYRILQKPGWFVGMVQTGRKVGVVPPLVHHFLTNNLNKPERFQRTFGCWLAMDSFYLRRRDIKKLLLETQLPTRIFIGKDDPMLKHSSLNKIYGDIPNVEMTWVEDGHRLVGEELGKML
jgi:pimeloyl-ACP methyl ester carboxylesterase